MVETSIEGKKVLLFFHNLNIEGAPIALLGAATILQKNEYHVCALSMADGPLRIELEKRGIEVLLCAMNHDTYPIGYDEYFKSFDLIIANTIMSYAIVRELDGIVPIIWYLHEGKTISQYFIKKIRGLEDTLKNASNIVVVSSYVKEFLIEKGLIKEAEILPNFVEDVSEISTREQSSPITFSLLGTVNYNKGFDILIRAYNHLSDSEKALCRINFAGQIVDNSYYEDCRKVISDSDDVNWKGVVTGEQKWQLFSDTDVMVVPSRDESCSLVVLEACMCGKPVIVSSNVGAQYMITDENGWIFANEDVNCLTRIMRNILSNPAALIEKGKFARKKYEKYATKEVYSKRLLDIVLKSMDKHQKPFFETVTETKMVSEIILLTQIFNGQMQSALGCYALQCFLNKNHFTTEIINYIPDVCREMYENSSSFGFALRNLNLSAQVLSYSELETRIENADNLLFNEKDIKNIPFLLCQEEWGEITGRRRIFKQYVATYFTKYKADRETLYELNVNSDAEKKSAELYFKESHEFCEIEEWLSYINYSEMVVTDDIDTIYFSIVFRKPCTFITRDRRDFEQACELFKNLEVQCVKPDNNRLDWFVLHICASENCVQQLTERTGKNFLMYIAGQQCADKKQRTKILTNYLYSVSGDNQIYLKQYQEKKNETLQNELVNLQQRCAFLETELIAYQKSLEKINNSVSLSVGRKITWLPRKIKKIIGDLRR